MPAASAIQTNFTAGQWSKKMAGRVDINKYHNSVAGIQNYIPIPQGPAVRRPGTRHVAEVKDSADETRVVRFLFSNTETYVLEFGDLYMRVYRDEGQVLSGATPYELTTPYAKEDVFDLQFAQSADVLYVAHRGYAPRKITRTGHTSWTIAAVSPTADPFTSAGNYPAAVALYEERSVWAGTDNDPQKMWFSIAGDFEDMTTGANPDDAMTYTIASNDVSVIQWMDSNRTLIVGTNGGIFEVTGSSLESAITPTSIQVNRRTKVAAHTASPIRVDSPLLYIQNTQRKLREFIYDYTINGYWSNDISLLADDIPYDGIKEMAMQLEPYPIVWMCTENGRLISCTYQREQEVVAWAPHQLGGDGKVKSLTVVPAPNNDHDQLWLVVERTIDGNTVQYVEFMENFFTVNDDIEDAFFVDSGLTYDSTPTTSISGLSHLEGETVDILADGGTHDQKTIASGEITLDVSASVVHVGFPMPSFINTNRLSPTHLGIRTFGNWTRVVKVFVRLLDSISLQVGPSSSDLDPVSFRGVADPMDSPVTRFTGDVEVDFEGDWSIDGMGIYIKQDVPLPSTVVGIVYRPLVE